MIQGSSILSAGNLGYLEALQARFKAAPETLDYSWRILFETIAELERSSPAGAPCRPEHNGNGCRLMPDTIRLRGHRAARLNPLQLEHVDAGTELIAEQAAIGTDARHLRSAYCDTLTVETAHIDDPQTRQWLYNALENGAALTDDYRAAILRQLAEAEAFEAMMRMRFPAKKRFGVEGADAVIPLMHRLIETAASSGVEHVVIATMHRGRMNILTNVLGKSLVELLAEFKGAHPFPADTRRPADVPYHLGYEGEVLTSSGPVRVTLTPNPSHLEAVNAVALGRARALQDRAGEGGRQSILPIVLHTDASVVGQGVVAELLQMSGVPGFDIGGTIHLVINNQIGFTTNIGDARTSHYCTGPWKAIDSAIFHVNGDDPEAACKAADIAVAFRQECRRDAVIDLVCYRRYGHNEIDDPTYTQPLEYAAIDRHPSVLELYTDFMAKRGLSNAGEVGRIIESYSGAFREACDNAEGYSHKSGSYRKQVFARPASAATGYPLQDLARIADTLATLPEGFAAHPRIHRTLGARNIEADRGIAWPLAEALAFASLLQDGMPIRLTGQDVTRGAFSHRHFRLFDQDTGRSDCAMDRLATDQAPFSVYDSPLSEYAVLAFEYGYSFERTEALTLWEAQFGDFANGAQTAIDQFVTSGEEKWNSASGLIMLLPHGLEGQGPEHSSARPERFLQLAANDNIFICNPSTPANYFHMLRRHAFLSERKPLVVTSPKKLLRLPAAVSPLEEFGPASTFRPVIPTFSGGDVDVVLLCTGKIAYDLMAEQATRKADNVAIVRIEQLYPFPEAELTDLLQHWPGARHVWVQEEPENMGAWTWVERRLRLLSQKVGATGMPIYAGRPEAASPAGSFHVDHERDQAAIVDQALSTSLDPGLARTVKGPMPIRKAVP